MKEIRQLRLALILWGLMQAPVFASSSEWPRATPQEADIDAQMISLLVQGINRGDYGKQKSLLILRHGKLVHEQYFRGNGPDTLMPMYSATKSWGSALIGIAIGNGDLEGVNVPLEQVFIDYPGPFQFDTGKQALTMEHVLTMRTGLAWDEWSTSFTDPANPVNQMTKSGDWWAFVLNRPMTAPADSVFRYSTGGSNLMGGVLWSLTGMSALEYSMQYLFAPLDITEHYVEVDLSGGPKGSGITTFQAGLTPTGHGLWLKASDLAKLGQLYLDRGVWDARRVLASQWINDSWKAYSDHASDPQVFGEGVSYGYQWWNFIFPGTKGNVSVHLAWGWADQFIFVVPSLDLVMVTTAENGSWSGSTMLGAFRDVVLGGILDDFDPVSDGGLTGSWYAPELAHQGFMLEVVPATGQVVIYWMTYEPGTNEQLWLIAVGQLHGRRSVLEFLRPQGGTFGGGEAADLSSWGDVELTFTSCTSATLHFYSAVAGVGGDIDLKRLTPNVTCIDD